MLETCRVIYNNKLLHQVGISRQFKYFPVGPPSPLKKTRPPDAANEYSQEHWCYIGVKAGGAITLHLRHQHNKTIKTYVRRKKTLVT